MSDYRVLARAYRPQNFDDLVGQEVLVRTLTNAFETGRIAHAFLLTGIRGIGKTTTARIIAKAMNCIGEEGSIDRPTITPCGVCANCVQIREDRHVDVLEMDAASHTGVGDVREIIESARYKPSSGRYKVYIIDEAHMLSNSAFNALLKTLEEPPDHVIFVLATTEIRKIPVTILSRCQRFDLRRLTTEEMTQHLQSIAEKEQVKADAEALELIAIASEGSVRDALSLLDQAIAHSETGSDSGIVVSAETVRGVLGLVDRTRLYTMLQHLFAGECKDALELLQAQHQDGANMVTLVQDMMQTAHVLSRMLVMPDYRMDRTYSDHERDVLQTMKSKLTIASVTKAWQLLLKGLDELKRAPNALAAAEMLFIRFSYAANLPDPGDLVKALHQSPPTNGAATPANVSAPVMTPAPALQTQASPAQAVAPTMETMAYDVARPNAEHLTLVANNPAQAIASFEEIVALLEEKREAILLHHLREGIQLVFCVPGELVIGKGSTLTTNAQSELKMFLTRQTGQPWRITRSDEEGATTLAQQEQRHREARMKEASTHPLVASILECFDDATMVEIETLPTT